MNKGDEAAYMDTPGTGMWARAHGPFARGASWWAMLDPALVGPASIKSHWLGYSRLGRKKIPRGAPVKSIAGPRCAS